MHNLFRSIGETPPDQQYHEASPGILPYRGGITQGRVDSPHQRTEYNTPSTRTPNDRLSAPAYHQQPHGPMNGIPPSMSPYSPSHHRMPPMMVAGRNNSISTPAFDNTSAALASALSPSEGQRGGIQKPFFNVPPRPESLSRMSGEFSPMPMRPSWRTSESRRSQAAALYNADIAAEDGGGHVAHSPYNSKRGHNAGMNKNFQENTNEEVTTPVADVSETENNQDNDGGGGIVQGLLRSARRFRKSLTSMTTSPVRSPSKAFEHQEEFNEQAAHQMDDKSEHRRQTNAAVLTNTKDSPLQRPRPPGVGTFQNGNLSTSDKRDSPLLDKSSSLRNSLLAAAASNPGAVSKAGSISGLGIDGTSSAANIPDAVDSWSQLAPGGGKNDDLETVSRLHKPQQSIGASSRNTESLGVPQMKPKRRMIQLEQRLKMATQVGACRAAALQRRDSELQKLRSMLNSRLPPRRSRAVQTIDTPDISESRRRQQLSVTRLTAVMNLAPAPQYFDAVCAAKIDLLQESTSVDADGICCDAKRNFAEANGRNVQLQEQLASTVAKVAAHEKSSQKASQRAKVAEAELKALRLRVSQLESELQDRQESKKSDSAFSVVGGCSVEMSGEETSKQSAAVAAAEQVLHSGDEDTRKEFTGDDYYDQQRDSDAPPGADIGDKLSNGGGAAMTDGPSLVVDRSKYRTPEAAVTASPDVAPTTGRRYRLRSGQQSSAAPLSAQAATKTRKKRAASKPSEVEGAVGDMVVPTKTVKDDRPVSGRGRKKKNEVL